MASAQAQAPQPQLNYRLRTITAYINLAKVDEDAVKAFQDLRNSGGDAADAAAKAAADAEAERLWGDELKETGEFLARAKRHFERAIPGLEVQTVRAASQRTMCEVFEAVRGEWRRRDGNGNEDAPDNTTITFPAAADSPVACLAAALERLAHREGVPMLSLGAVLDDDAGATLRHVPAVLEATKTVSCSFEALWRHSAGGWGDGDDAFDCAMDPDYEDGETYATYRPRSLRLAAQVKLEVARRTKGHGNFRFAIAAGCNADGGWESGWKPKIRRRVCGCNERKYMDRERETEPSLGPMPFFPVAGGCPGGPWRSGGVRRDSPCPTYFALGCETDGLLRTACERVRAAFDAAAAGGGGGATRRGGGGGRRGGGGGRAGAGAAGAANATTNADAELAAAARAGRVTALLKRVLAEELTEALKPLRKAALELDAGERGRMADAWRRAHGGRSHRDFLERGYGAYSEPWGFCGVDTSLAPGLDTPSLTGSFELLLPLFGQEGESRANAAAAAASAASSSSANPPAPRFGDPGTLALCSAVTRALQAVAWDVDSDKPDDDPDDVPAEPPTTTGYCGLMLAVLEDQGLAEAASAGRLSVERLLAWSSVCGTGLDTVPIPGPRWRVAAAATAAGNKRRARQEEEEEQEDDEESARRHDEALAGRIAAVAADVCAMALRLRKPLSVRLLPLPMLKAGDETRRALGGHPYLLDSRVMEL